MPITLRNDQITWHTEAHMHYDGGPILAIDAATRCGFAFGEPGKTPLLESIALRRPTDPRTVAFGNASRIIYRFINSPTPPVLVVIEDCMTLDARAYAAVELAPMDVRPVRCSKPAPAADRLPPSGTEGKPLAPDTRAVAWQSPSSGTAPAQTRP